MRQVRQLNANVGKYERTFTLASSGYRLSKFLVTAFCLKATNLLIKEHVRKKQEEAERRKKEFMEKWKFQEIENASEHLQRFAALAKPPARFSQETMTPSGFSSTEEDTNQVNVDSCFQCKYFRMGGTGRWIGDIRYS